VVGQLPRIYSAKASEAYKTFQANQSLETIDAAIEAFQEAEEAATEYGESSIAAQMAGNIPQLYYVKSLVQFRQEDLEGASATLDLAMDANANYAQAYFQKAIVMRKQGKATADVVSMFDQAITLAEMYDQGQVASRATDQAVQTLLSSGAQAVQNNQITDGIDLLNRAAEYETDEADVFFRLAEAYNKRSQYDEAISNAQRALELESGGVADKAKIYFELGFAHQMQNNKDAACSAMKNASYGDFRDPANHKMEFELKCPGTSGS
jgi:tetratricopeptide (TPR) repeat protein